MKVSLDFEFEYDVADADELGLLMEAIEDAAFIAKHQTPGVKITKVTQRVAGFYPDQLHNELTLKALK